MESNKATTLQDVLEAVNAGFSHMEERFVGIETRMDKIEVRMDKIEVRMDTIEVTMKRLEKIVDNWPPPSTVRDLIGIVGNLKHRIEVLEKQNGIVSS